MVTCYTLARVEPAQDKTVLQCIRDFPEVKEVIMTYGEYDLIIKIEEETIEKLDHFIFNKLRITPGLAATTTLIQARPAYFEKEE
jgi:DNA-binding Lrp family transcriptional regulator